MPRRYLTYETGEYAGDSAPEFLDDIPPEVRREANCGDRVIVDLEKGLALGVSLVDDKWVEAKGWRA